MERERQKVLDPFFGRLLLLDLMEINVREILHRLAIQILRKRVLEIENAAFSGDLKRPLKRMR